MTVSDVLGSVDELADGMGGSVDAVTGAAIGPYRKSRVRRTKDKEGSCGARSTTRIRPRRDETRPAPFKEDANDAITLLDRVDRRNADSAPRGARGRPAREAGQRELPRAGGRPWDPALRPQQAAGGDDDLHARPDPALRPRRDLPGGDDVRSPARRPLVDGLHRSTGLRRVPDGRPRLRALDAPPRDGAAGPGEPADRAY